MILIRFVLVSLIIFLIIRSFLMYFGKKETSTRVPGPEKKSKISSKRVSKEIGEYVDYEDVDK